MSGRNAPRGLGSSGRRVWREHAARVKGNQSAEEMLTKAARMADRVDALDAIVTRDGLMVDSSQGPKVHPASVESRQLMLALSKVLAGLRDVEPASDPDADLEMLNWSPQEALRKARGGR